jgi:hypothetical protein
MGYVFTNKGVMPDESKESAIQNMGIPTCKKDVQRFLGMVTCVAKFIPHIPN